MRPIRRFVTTLLTAISLSTIAIAESRATPTLNHPTESLDSVGTNNDQDDARSLVRGIDVFGTEQITAEQVRQAWGGKITQLAEAIYGRPSNPEKVAEDLYQEIVTGIQAMGDFAYVEVSPVMYFEEGNPVYITVDIVDTEDVPVRMPFRPSPTGTVTDPDQLLQQWAEYEETAFILSMAGELRDGYSSCPALSCTFGFEHPELQAFSPIFEAGTSANRDQLVQILYKERDAAHRGYAVFLLAFTDDVINYVHTITPAITDPSSLVRNNALRVLIHIAQDYPEIEMPIEHVIEALQYPDTTDRNKSAYILVELAKQADYHEFLIEQAVPTLLEMLRLEQPNNHDPAYTILTALSGESYEARDYAAWEHWAEQALTTARD